MDLSKEGCSIEGSELNSFWQRKPPSSTFIKFPILPMKSSKIKKTPLTKGPSLVTELNVKLFKIILWN